MASLFSATDNSSTNRHEGNKGRRRVVHILPWLGGGGVEQRRYLMAQYLDDEKYEQNLVYMTAENDWLSLFEQEGVRLIHVPGAKAWSPTDFKAIGAIARHLRRIDPDIVHGAVFEGVSMATFAGRLAGIQNIIIEETGDPSIRRLGGNLLMGLYSALVTACVGVSRPVSDYFTQTLHTPESKVFCIENGVRAMSPPTAEEKRTWRHQWGISDNDIVIGSVGRMNDEHKRFSGLIDLVPTLREQNLPVKLLLVGDGQDLEKLQNRAKSLDISDHVVFPGFQREIESFFGMMDIFALLSFQEAFGLVVAEAMMCELPTVITSVGGMKYLTVDGKTGFQVPGDTPEAAEAPLRKLIEDESLRNTMGASGRERALEKYSHQAYIEKVEKLYGELLGKSDGRVSKSPFSI